MFGSLLDSTASDPCLGPNTGAVNEAPLLGVRRKIMKMMKPAGLSRAKWTRQLLAALVSQAMQQVAPYLRRSSAVAQALAVMVVTFCVLLPLVCHRLLFSYFFLRSLYLDTMSEQVLRDSLLRGQDALHFWQTLPSSVRSPVNTTRHPALLVSVVSSRRHEGRDFHYLLQVMQRLHSLLDGCGGRRCAEVLICNVEAGDQENTDAKLLERHYRVIQRPPRRYLDYVNIFEKEKRDYVFCLRRGWELLHPNNMVVLEDDALPGPDFFSVIRDLLQRRFAARSLYVKLYHPERLQRYWNPEPYRILEWLGLGAVLATALLVSCYASGPALLTLAPGPLLFFTLYFMAVAELGGRHYLLEARRLSPQLYAVSPATECCTPAMLFPHNSSQRVAQYLDQAFCTKGNAKDTVLYHMAREMPGERAHSLEPNLIRHIGAYSSVRTNPARPKLL